MSNMKYLVGGIAASALTAAIVAPAQAQVTTSGIGGVVTNETGQVVGGATVTVTDTRTGFSRSATTSDSGQFSFRNLSVGGPYTVSVSAADYQAQSVEDISLQLGNVETLAFALTTDDTRTLDAVIVTASAADAAQVAVGPSAAFGLETLQNAPAINRDIRDIIRLDPRIFVDEAFVDAVQCASANPRFNSLTVDGVRLNDSFGLNSNGYPTERAPFSFDAIEQVAVELAPFDVQYGGFSACNINAVTKSGANEFFGGAFIDYTSDSLEGSSLEGQDVNVAEFDEYRYGFNVGGPIIKDRLFFFAAYEKLEGANTFDRGPEGSGAAREVAGFTQNDFDEILRIARDIYQYDPGETPTSFDNEDEKILVRLDWNINDNHRANFVYNYNDGFNISQSDGDSDEFEFSNHLYERGAELNSYVGSLFSDWNENFSTEFRLGYVELDNRQISVGGTDFGEMQITVDDGVNDAVVYIGGDDSRQSNKLSYEVMTYVAKASYQAGDHLFTGGFEREELDIFNLFVQHTEGEYRFGSIADFEAGEPFRIEYANAPSGNPADAAAVWGYAVNTLYLQDEFSPNPDLNLVFGLRYDWYTSDDAPGENSDFVDQYGFSNSTNLDGEGLLQPRFGFTWDARPDLSLRGGFGVFSGGNPNVWLSNNFSSNNELQFTVRDSDVGIAGTSLFDPAQQYVDCEDGAPVGPGWCIPAEMAAAVAGGGRNFEINVLDPNFEIPSEWKFALGGTYFADLPIDNFLGGEYVVNADVLYTEGRDSARVARLDLQQEGTTAGGLIPDYASPNLDAFFLTNTQGIGSRAWNLSASVFKEYDFGLDWTFGYAWSDAKEVQPMTSSVAFSNYNNRTFVDPEETSLSTSNYNVEHRFVFNTNYRRAFFGDYETKIGAVLTSNSGRPFSFTFEDPNSIYGFTPFLSGEVLLYVPTGPNDPLVTFDPGFDQDAFFAYLAANDLNEYAGGFAPRNAFEGDWWTKVDLRFEQELPGIREGHKTAAFMVVENFTNLLNDEWGVLYQPNFPGSVDIVDASATDTGFVFESFSPQSTQSRVGNPSRWAIRLGLRYEF